MSESQWLTSLTRNTFSGQFITTFIIILQSEKEDFNESNQIDLYSAFNKRTLSQTGYTEQVYPQ